MGIPSLVVDFTVHNERPAGGNYLTVKAEANSAKVNGQPIGSGKPGPLWRKILTR